MTDAEFYAATRRWERGEITFADYMEAIGPVPRDRALSLFDEWSRWDTIGDLAVWAALCLVTAACALGPMSGRLPGWTEHLGLVPLPAWLLYVWRHVRRERRLNREIQDYLEGRP